MISLELKDLKHQILSHIEPLLRKPPHAGHGKAHTDALAQLLALVTGVSADFDMNEWQDADLPSGVAISPVQAAKCLQEAIRTQVFIQGVEAAIVDQLTKHNRVNILYAGTGPYGLLVLPLLCLMLDKRISVTLLDIHPENIVAVNKLIQTLEIAEYIKHVELADATRWQPSKSESFDLIISETMNTLLRREPQVTIFAHLQQFLSADGVLIPESINIGALLELSAGEFAESGKEKNKASIDLGSFFQLNQATARALANGDLSNLSGEIKLPKIMNPKGPQGLKFSTAIEVYKNHQLGENSCSLTMPVYYHNLKLASGKAIQFSYQMNENPKFIFKFPIKELTLELPEFRDTGKLGLYQLKRLWKKSLLYRNNKLDQKHNSQEWELDLKLLELLALPLDKTLAYLYAVQPDFDSFEQWIKQNVVQQTALLLPFPSEQITFINDRLSAFRNEGEDQL